MKKKILSKLTFGLISAFALLGASLILPGMAKDVWASETISYIYTNNDGEREAGSTSSFTRLNYYLSLHGEDPISLEQGTYFVDISLGLDRRLIVTGGEVKIIIKDNYTLAARKGIGVHSGSTLYIYSQSDGDNAGELVADASSMPGCAGIGGTYYESDDGSGKAGEIIIHGGKITATGGDFAAGIGGRSHKKAVENETGTVGAAGCGDGEGIVIYGGDVTANGGKAGAGIGGGSYGAGKMVYINGGKVTAVGGGYGAAAIGGGGLCSNDINNSYEDGQDIWIYGGTVIANATTEGAGIGAGADGTYVDVNIRGGNVTATGAGKGAGIGSYEVKSNSDARFNIVITNGEITATGGVGDENNWGGSGIGCGYRANGADAYGNINIEGGKITATGGYNVAGIGGISDYSFEAIQIIDGIIVAKSSSSLGIGGPADCTTRIALRKSDSSVQAQTYLGKVKIEETGLYSPAHGVFYGELAGTVLNGYCGGTIENPNGEILKPAFPISVVSADGADLTNGEVTVKNKSRYADGEDAEHFKTFKLSGVTYAAPGDTVEITAVPDADYYVSGFDLKNKDGNSEYAAINPTKAGDGTIRFAMAEIMP